MKYYLNSFFLYSILGFILESVFFKINRASTYSGFMYGPFTIIYGISCVILMLIDKYFFKKLNYNKVFKTLIIYVVCMVVLTSSEFVGGILLKGLFDIELWNYSNKMFNFGKYICLEMALVWGGLGVLFVYYIRPFGDKIVKKWSYRITLLFGVFLVVDFFTFLIFK